MAKGRCRLPVCVETFEELIIIQKKNTFSSLDTFLGEHLNFRIFNEYGDFACVKRLKRLKHENDISAVSKKLDKSDTENAELERQLERLKNPQKKKKKVKGVEGRRNLVTRSHKSIRNVQKIWPKYQWNTSKYSV